MKNIYVFGASGFGREVAWLIESNEDYHILGFIDDDPKSLGKVINGYEVVGNTEYLLKQNQDINVVVAIGKPSIRKKIVDNLKQNKNIKFPNIISKDAKISNSVSFGEGNIVCMGNILTTNISIGNFNHINLNCTLGHDDCLNDYVTVYPGVNISGNVTVGNFCELGTGSKIIQGLLLTDNVILGAGGVVVKDLIEEGTYVGVPVKKVGK